MALAPLAAAEASDVCSDMIGQYDRQDLPPAAMNRFAKIRVTPRSWIIRTVLWPRLINQSQKRKQNMKKQKSTIGISPTVSLITAVTTGVVMTLANASAQTETGSDRYQGASKSYQQSQSGDQDQDLQYQYTAVVRDPVTGTWTRVTRFGEDQGRREQARKMIERRRDQAQQRMDGSQDPQQQWRQTRKDQEPRQQQQARQDSQGSGAVSLEGTVQAFREVSLRRGEDMPQQHSWIKIDLESGYTAIIDLGPEKDLSDLELERGDQIKVWGRHGTIAGENVLIADRVRIGNQTITIERQKTRQEVSGKIRDYSEVNWEDSERQDHLFVRFQMEDGRRIIADLGKDASLEDLEIERDAQVKISGEPAVSAGQRILVAKKITVEGDTTELRQQDEQENQD